MKWKTEDKSFYFCRSVRRKVYIIDDENQKNRCKYRQFFLAFDDNAQHFLCIAVFSHSILHRFLICYFIELTVMLKNNLPGLFIQKFPSDWTTI